MRIDTAQTGNKRLDSLIAKALLKDPIRKNLSKVEALLSVQKEMRENKYGVAAKEDRTIENITFASKREMTRWNELRLMEQAGEIKMLQRQISFELQEGFTSKQVGNIRPIHYIADFVYKNHEGRMVVEDSKGVRTSEYKLKRKLFLYKYGEYLFFEV